MTEEQFEALKAWINAAYERPHDAASQQHGIAAAESRAREAFLGKTWEQE